MEGCKACRSVLMPFSLMSTHMFSSRLIPGCEKSSTEDLCLSLSDCIEGSMISFPPTEGNKNRFFFSNHSFDETIWPGDLGTLLAFSCLVWSVPGHWTKWAPLRERGLMLLVSPVSPRITIVHLMIYVQCQCLVPGVVWGHAWFSVQETGFFSLLYWNFSLP